jgi:hypothetical protein
MAGLQENARDSIQTNTRRFLMLSFNYNICKNVGLPRDDGNRFFLFVSEQSEHFCLMVIKNCGKGEAQYQKLNPVPNFLLIILLKIVRLTERTLAIKVCSTSLYNLLETSL